MEKENPSEKEKSPGLGNCPRRAHKRRKFVYKYDNGKVKEEFIQRKCLNCDKEFKALLTNYVCNKCKADPQYQFWASNNYT